MIWSSASLPPPVPPTMWRASSATSRNVVCAVHGYPQRHQAPRRRPRILRRMTASPSPLLPPRVTTGISPTRPARQQRRSQLRLPYRITATTLREVASAGHGIIRPAAFLLGEDLRAGRLVRLLPDYALNDTDLPAIYPSRRHLSAKVRVMVDFLRRPVQGHATLGPRDRALSQLSNLARRDRAVVATTPATMTRAPIQVASA